MHMDAPPPGDGPSGDFSVPDTGKQLSVLTQRADFLRAARARRQPMPGFLLQARLRATDEPAATPIRIGFTCSKKVGNAVARNRAKRRLRAVVAEALLPGAQPGWDYVLIGRPGVTIDRDFQALKNDLAYALRKLHTPS